MYYTGKVAGEEGHKLSGKEIAMTTVPQPFSVYIHTQLTAPLRGFSGPTKHN